MGNIFRKRGKVVKSYNGLLYFQKYAKMYSGITGNEK